MGRTWTPVPAGTLALTVVVTLGACTGDGPDDPRDGPLASPSRAEIWRP